MSTLTTNLSLIKHAITDTLQKRNDDQNSNMDTLDSFLASLLANLLTNPGFEVWQRGAGPFTADGAYMGDRWQINLGTSSTISISRDNTNQDTDSQFCAAITYTHSAASSLEEGIEDFYQLRGKQVTLSVRVKTSTANAASLRIDDSVGQGASGSSHSGGGTYETLTATKTINAAAASVTIRILLDASATVYVDNAMLVTGSVAAEYVPLHPADDLARCQRYYEVHGGGNVVFPRLDLYAGTTETIGTSISFNTSKAVTPTLTKNGTWSVTNCGQPLVSSAGASGYLLSATPSGAGRILANPDTSDDTVTAEANP